MTVIKQKSVKFNIILTWICFIITSCSGNKTLYNLSKEDRNNTRYKGHFKIGTAYVVKGKKYTPKAVSRYSATGYASWYGTAKGFHGKKTANGDIYNKELLTAAHRTLPLPSLVKVTNLENGKSLIVMVNDRGPYHKGREIDLSQKAATLLGFKNKGIAKVHIQYLHNETTKLLSAFNMKRVEGARASRGLENKKCSVNCHIKLVNQKYRLATISR